MFKSKLLLLTVIMSIAFVSCQKESLNANLEEQSPSAALVKSKTEGNNTETYYYDADKRLSKIVFSSSTNNNTYYHEYTYTANEITEYRSEEPRYALEQALPNGATRINCSSNPSELKLNEKGFYIGTVSNCQTQSFQYDENGFVITQDLNQTDYSTNEKFVNDSKNVTRKSGNGFSYGNGTFNTNTIYTYYTDKLNSIGNKNFGKAYLGKSSDNLVASETQNNITTNYSYKFDSQQRVIQKTTKLENVETQTYYTYY